MTFRGWKAEALEFFDGLEADNSKTYWQANTSTYEELVRAPMEELVAELAPKGYPKDHPRIDLLRYKGIVAWREWQAGAWLGTPRAKDRLVEFFRLTKPLSNWLRTNVGPSTMAENRR